MASILKVEPSASTSLPVASGSSGPDLKHRVGLFSLTAIAVNGIIGAAIFVLPANVAQIVGRASALPYLIAFVSVSLIGLCFASLGAWFDASGGPYVYAREAFGDFIGFEAGWLFILARLTAVAAITNVFASYFAYIVPEASAGFWRGVVVTSVLTILAGSNLVGLQFGTYVLNSITIGKLVPILLFVLIGIFFIHIPKTYFLEVAPPAALQKATLLLIFAFTGFEYACVPSEEVLASKRNTPIAILTAICFTGVLYTSVQIVCVGTLPGLAANAIPLASAARTILGPVAAYIMTLGAVLSAAGTISAVTLVGPRMMYVLAREGHFPKPLGSIHRRYNTPYLSILLFAGIALILTLFSDFAGLAALSSIARLLYYVMSCLAVPVLTAKSKRSTAKENLRSTRQIVIPVLATAICGWLLTSITRQEAIVGGCALLLGGSVYWIYRAQSENVFRNDT